MDGVVFIQPIFAPDARLIADRFPDAVVRTYERNFGVWACMPARMASTSTTWDTRG